MTSSHLHMVAYPLRLPLAYCSHDEIHDHECHLCNSSTCSSNQLMGTVSSTYKHLQNAQYSSMIIMYSRHAYHTFVSQNQDQFKHQMWVPWGKQLISGHCMHLSLTTPFLINHLLLYRYTGQNHKQKSTQEKVLWGDGKLKTSSHWRKMSQYSYNS